MPPIQGRPVDHKLPEVLLAVERGITITGAAKVLGCQRNTVRSYCKRWSAVQAAIDEHRQELVDLAEMGLRGAVMNKEAWAVTFALRTLAPHIYAEQVNVKHEGNKEKPVVIEHLGAAEVERAEIAFIRSLGLQPPRLGNATSDDYPSSEGTDAIRSPSVSGQFPNGSVAASIDR